MFIPEVYYYLRTKDKLPKTKIYNYDGFPYSLPFVMMVRNNYNIGIDIASFSPDKRTLTVKLLCNSEVMAEFTINTVEQFAAIYDEADSGCVARIKEFERTRPLREAYKKADIAKTALINLETEMERVHNKLEELRESLDSTLKEEVELNEKHESLITQWRDADLHARMVEREFALSDP
jgi:hypothetical protein